MKNKNGLISDIRNALEELGFQTSDTESDGVLFEVSHPNSIVIMGVTCQIISPVHPVQPNVRKVIAEYIDCLQSHSG